MKHCKFTIFIILFVPIISFGSKIDELKKKLETELSDTSKCNTLINLSNAHISKSTNDALLYVEEALQLSEKIHNKKYQAEALNTKGIIKKKMGKYDEAIKLYKQSYSIFKDLNDQKSMATVLNRLGVANKNLGNLEVALDYYAQAKEKCLLTNDTNTLLSIYNNIGIVYKHLGEYEKALSNYFECLKLNEKYGDADDIANVKNNIAVIYRASGQSDKAFELYNEVLEIHKANNNIEGQARSLGYIANAYSDLKKDYVKSNEYNFKALELAKQYGNESLIANILANTGSNFNGLKDYKTAIEYFEKALNIYENSSNDYASAYVLFQLSIANRELNNLNKAKEYAEKGYEIVKEYSDYSMLRDAHKCLHTVYEAMKKYDLAYYHLNELHKMEMKQNTEEKNKLVAEQQAIYESYKKEQEIEVLQKEKALSEAELNKKKITIYAFIAGFALFLILIVVVIKNNREKSKTLTILEESNTKIVLQKNIIEQKNKDITDSILYAKRIQSAMLNRNENFAKKFKEFFVLYLPKDIVSGDFYWLNENNDSLFFSVADCTGHGVPGAFMSIIGYNSLNAALEKNISSPSKILHFLDERVKNALTSSNNEAVKDGMDIAICKLNKHNNELTFGGAINSAITVYENEINVLKGSKKYIGNGLSEVGEMNFEEKNVKLRDREMVYLASDGFADQFGGEKGKKLKTANYKKILLDIYKKPLAEQREILLKEFQAWKKDYEQIDDICVLGIRV